MTQYPDRAPLPGYDPADGWDGKSGNLGLWYDKYCDRWHDSFSTLYKPVEERTAHGQIVTEGCDGGRIEWLRKALAAARAQRNGNGMLAEYAQRQKLFVTARDGICFRAKTIRKFASGLGRAHPVQNGFEWHYTLGVPVVRASGQKGMALDWTRIWIEPRPEALCDRILGTVKNAGSVDFLPALPVVWPKLCIDGTTPHLKEYYQDELPPADWYDPTPLQWLAVDCGSEFQFALVPSRGGTAEDVAIAGRWLIDALTTIGAGAATAADRGVFEWTSGWHYDPALRSPI